MKKQRLTVVVETSSIFYVYILYKVKKKKKTSIFTGAKEPNRELKHYICCDLPKTINKICFCEDPVIYSLFKPSI